MAASKETESSYWQQVRLQYADGLEILTSLDAPTARRLQKGDNDLMETIRKQWLDAQMSDTQSITMDTQTEQDTQSELTGQDTQTEFTDTPTETSSEASNVPKLWNSKIELDTLVELRMSMEEEFLSAKTHKMLWDRLAKEMAEKGFICTAKQCANKYKHLKREFRATIDHNNLSGNNRKTCPYFEKFNSLYGLKPSTSADFTLSSSPNATEERDPPAPPQSSRTPQSSKKKKVKSATVDWLESHEKKILAQREQFHQDKMQVMHELIDVLKK